MDKDYTLLAMGAGLTIIGTFVNFLLDQANRRQDKQREKEGRFYDSRKEIYAQTLGILRSMPARKPEDEKSDEYKEWIKHRKECDMIISQSILFAKKDLGSILLKAGSSNYSGNWKEKYGKERPEALVDLEVLMKEELGIEVRPKEKILKRLKNFYISKFKKKI